MKSAVETRVSQNPRPGVSDTYTPGPSYQDVKRGRDRFLRGHSGRGVAEFQSKLKQTGARIEVDGFFGPQCERSVIRFQREHRLHVSGQVDRELLSTIEGILAPLKNDTHLAKAAVYVVAANYLDQHHKGDTPAMDLLIARLLREEPPLTLDAGSTNFRHMVKAWDELETKAKAAGF
jgi:peptidoglycan hydrolase-like protein with peptidoglycan-binding domain